MENRTDPSEKPADPSLEDLQQRAKDIKERNEQTTEKLRNLQQQSARLLDSDTAANKGSEEQK